MTDLDRWQQQEYTGMALGLHRIRRFLAAIGNPERRLPAVHVAGTNGKGSVSRMVAGVLSSAGYRTGLYTSPHIRHLAERIMIDGVPISRAHLSRISRRLGPLGRQHGLTFFEFLTGMAFAYFAEQKVDIVVLETGLGGRFDATNVIRRPHACVITSIGRDHEHILGPSIADIAREKAGIIKARVPLVLGRMGDTAGRVISAVAHAKQAPLIRYGKDVRAVSQGTDWATGIQTIAVHGRVRGAHTDTKGLLSGTFRVPLVGQHQAVNSGVAIACCDVLSRAGFPLDRAAVSAGMAGAAWPGRFDIRHVGRQTLVIDGAHNIDAIRAFVRTWKSSPWGSRRRPFVFGALRDKDYRTIIRAIAPFIDTVVIVPVRSPRAVAPEALARICGGLRGLRSVRIAPSAAAAVRLLSRESVIAVVGSLYLAGEMITTVERRSR